MSSAAAEDAQKPDNTERSGFVQPSSYLRTRTPARPIEIKREPDPLDIEHREALVRRSASITQYEADIGYDCV